MDLSLPDITLSTIMLRLGAALITLFVYGPVAVWAVRRSGDPGPTQDGRLTLSPFAHLDVFGLVAAIFFRATWLRSLRADPRLFRRPAAGTAFTILVTSLALLLLAVLALYARPLVLRAFSSSLAFSAAALLTATSEIATATVVLNILPIPPLLGGLWWATLGRRPAQLASQTRTRAIGTVVVAAILLSGMATPVFGWAWRSLRQLVGF